MARTRQKAAFSALVVVLLGSLLAVTHAAPAQAVTDGATRTWWGTITITGSHTSRGSDEYATTNDDVKFRATLSRTRGGLLGGEASWTNLSDSANGECYSHDRGWGAVTFPAHTEFTDAPVAYDAGAAAWTKEFPQIWVPTTQVRDANCDASGQHYFDWLIGHPRCVDQPLPGTACWPESLNLTVTAAAVADRAEPRVTETKSAVLYHDGDPGSGNYTHSEVTISYDVSWRVDGPEAADEEPAANACARTTPGSGIKKKLRYTTAAGKSRWVVLVGPDAKLATFDVGFKWCTTPDGPAFKGTPRVDSQVVAHWALLGALESAGFVVVAEEPTVSIERRTLVAGGRIVGAFQPLEVALNVLPITRALSTVTKHVDDCFLKIAGGVDPARALPEMVEALKAPVKKLKKAVEARLRKKLDRTPGISSAKAAKLADRWLKGLGDVGTFLVDDLAKRVALGEVAVKGAARLVGESWRSAFGQLTFTIWRPEVWVSITKRGKHLFTNHSESPLFLPIKDEWEHKTVP